MADTQKTPTPATTPNTSAPVTVNDLLKLIAAMKTDSTAPGQVTATDLTALVQSIQAMTPKKKVLFSEFKTKSPFNPTGNKRRKLERICYQNGARMRLVALFDEEIKLLNTLPVGRFLDNLVTVRLEPGSNGALDKMHIEYANRTHDQRIAIAQRIRSLVALLRQIHEEAKAQ